MLRIVFSIAYCQQHLPVRLVSATTKSRWNFYAQVQRLSFHTGWVKNGSPDAQAGGPLCSLERTSAAAPLRSEKCQQETHAPQQT